MAITAAQLVADVSVLGADKAKLDLSSVGSAASSTGNIFKSAVGGVMGAAAAGAGMALTGLKDVMEDSIQVAMKHQVVAAQTAAALKSTKDASGETAASIDQMSTALSRQTMFSKDSIQTGQNMLLTFTGIGKQVFPQATQAMLDLSQATGQSLTSSAMQLGKALGDPLKGMSALQRVGVSFSKDEQEQIKTMMAHNNVIGAQQVMLKELSTEFGGSATAAGKTFAGQMAILQNSMEDFKESLGEALLPMLNGLVSFITSNVMPIVNKFGDWFTQTAIPNIEKFLGKFAPLKSAFSDVSGYAKVIEGSFSQMFGAIGKMFEPLTDKFKGLGKGFSIQSIVNDVKNAIGGIADFINTGVQNITKIISKIDIKPFVNGISGAFKSIDWGGIGNTAGKIFGAIGDAISKIDWKAVGNDVKSIGKVFMDLSPAGNIIQALSSHASELGKWFNTSVVPAIKQAQPGFKSLTDAIGSLWPIIQKVADIIHNTFQKAFDALLPVFEKAVPIIIQIAGIVSNGLGAAIKFLAPYILQAVDAVGKFVDGLATRLAPILNNILGFIQGMLKWLSDNWPVIWGTLGPILQGVWDTIKGIIQIAWSLITGIINTALDLLSGNWSAAWNDIKNMLGGVWDGIVSVIKGAINLMIGALNLGIDALNGFIDAVEKALNSAANAVGLGNPIPITTIAEIPKYASGTSDHPGGPALVGEKGPEMVLLPKGTSVIPAGPTAQMLSYAGGTGDWLSSLTSWIGGGVKSIVDGIMKGLKLSPILGGAVDWASGITNKLESWITDWVKNTLMPKIPGQGGGSAGPGTPVNIPGDLASWIMQAIGLTGVPASWANDLGIIAMHESGGNPNAINNWDINAQEGHPSQGIMQTIPSTFAAYMIAGHGNILNPIDNIAAAIGYIKARYGTVFNVPGIVSMAAGGPYQGYANGVNNAPGGYSWVGEKGPELMYVPKGANITPNDQINQIQQPIIHVHPASVYLDGRILATALLPYQVDAIRSNTGYRQ